MSFDDIGWSAENQESLLNFLKEEAKVAEKLVESTYFPTKFKELVQTEQTRYQIALRINKIKENIEELEGFDEELKQKMCLMLGVERVPKPQVVEEGPKIVELENDEDKEEVDDEEEEEEEEHQEDEEEGDEENDTTVGSQNQIEHQMMQFLSKKVAEVDTFITDVSFFAEFKAATGIVESTTRLRERYLLVKDQIHFDKEFDRNTRAKMMYYTKAKINEQVLDEIRAWATIEVDDKNRLVNYKSKDGTFELGNANRKKKASSYKPKTPKQEPVDVEESEGEPEAEDVGDEEEKEDDDEDVQVVKKIPKKEIKKEIKKEVVEKVQKKNPKKKRSYYVDDENDDEEEEEEEGYPIPMSVSRSGRVQKPRLSYGSTLNLEKVGDKRKAKSGLVATPRASSKRAKHQDEEEEDDAATASSSSSKKKKETAPKKAVAKKRGRPPKSGTPAASAVARAPTTTTNNTNAIDGKTFLNSFHAFIHDIYSPHLVELERKIDDVLEDEEDYEIPMKKLAVMLTATFDIIKQ